MVRLWGSTKVSVRKDFSTPEVTGDYIVFVHVYDTTSKQWPKPPELADFGEPTNYLGSQLHRDRTPAFLKIPFVWDCLLPLFLLCETRLLCPANVNCLVRCNSLLQNNALLQTRPAII